VEEFLIGQSTKLQALSSVPSLLSSQFFVVFSISPNEENSGRERERERGNILLVACAWICSVGGPPFFLFPSDRLEEEAGHIVLKHEM
jgi:hypothetical protein